MKKKIEKFFSPTFKAQIDYEVPTVVVKKP